MADALQEERVPPNAKIILVGFGAGLTWGATLLEWDVEPTPRTAFSEVLREGWYILARVRSLLLRLRRFVEAIIYAPQRRRRNRDRND